MTDHSRTVQSSWKHYRGTLAASSIVVILLISALANTATIHRQLDAWKLLPRPERLTELYYENHTALPTSYTPGTAQSFSFTVHNIEYRSLTYRYQVIEQSEDASRKQTLASGRFALDQGAYHTQPVSVVPIDLGARSKIVTSLSPVDETIAYWVEDTTRPEGA